LAVLLPLGEVSMSERREPQLPHAVDLAIVAALPEELNPGLNLIGGREHWESFTLDHFIHYRQAGVN
jgi:hypothetical protein